MITARIHCNADDIDGVVVQLTTMPRIGETISLTESEQPEIDLIVIEVNHLVKLVEGHLQQIEIVVFAQPQ